MTEHFKTNTFGPIALNLIKRNERDPRTRDFVPKEYKDSRGLATIGWGHRVLPGEDFSNGITREEAEALFRRDLLIAERGARAYLPEFDSLSPERQAVLVDMAFNLGQGRLSGFEDMKSAILEAMAPDGEIGFQVAKGELLNSEYASQVGNRAVENGKIMESGEIDFRYFE